MTVTTAAEVLDFWFSGQMQPYWFAIGSKEGFALLPSARKPDFW